MKIARRATNILSDFRNRSLLAAAAAVGLLLSSSLTLPSIAAPEPVNNVNNPKVIGLRPARKGPTVTPDELILMPKSGADQDEISEALDKVGAVAADKDLLGKFVMVKVPKEDIDKAYKELSKDKNFAFVSRNHINSAQFTTTPNDPGFPQQWYLQVLDVPNAWALGAAGQGVTIASIDSGCDFANPDLQNRFASLGYASFLNGPPGYCFFDPFSTDSFSHGTFTMTCFGATTNNSFGFAGPAFQSQIIPINVSGSTPDLALTDLGIAKGIQFAFLSGAKLANLSINNSDPLYNLMSPGAPPILRYSIAAFGSVGGVMFGAAGNDGNQVLGVPIAGYVPVAAIDQTLTPTSFTDFGNAVMFAAPGAGITNTGFSGQTFTLDGTSFASPLSAGVFAQIQSANPGLTGLQVVQIMATTAQHNASLPPNFFGAGIPDAAAGVALAKHSF
jgi:thermitase